MRGLVWDRADWEGTRCCRPPSSPTWCNRINVLAYLCRWVSGYRERSVFEQLEDHLLHDIGVDAASVRRPTSERERAVRRLWRIAIGGIY